ncbi:lambda family phage tail tape measure protein [Paraburkholderia bannensis]|uniref:Lambda family phage tail tape measure protein n=1 Tax=Paraburkholderia bannensis TaxID=765414 RepID=A0A7W9WTD1_9BURK|nr:MULTISPECIES: phage tail tape measure protein [Paraburkholderia]MBB3260004.1 lambda family phage tail tape measure protein [Paraburkholderia sp. WP4_3_2]MBB6105210.1 lambda family phage tail tape measure protein [Paraburkholderia bannensis]
MSDEVGKAVLSVEADVDKLDVSLRQGAASVEQFERTAKQSAGAAADSISAIGDSAGEAATKVSVGGQRILASLEREVIQTTQGKIAWLEYRAARAGVGDEAAPLIAQLRAAEAAAAAQAAAFGSASVASAQFAESEEQASERIRAMVTRSREQVEAMNAVADSAQRAAASVGSVGVGTGTAGKSRLASEFVPGPAATQTVSKMAAADVAALLTQIDPAAKRLDALDEAEERLRSAFKSGAVDAQTYNGALSKIGSQREAIAKVSEAGQKGSSVMSSLARNSHGASAELMVLGREAASGNFHRMGSSLSILAQQAGLVQLAFTPMGAAVLGVTGALALGAAGFVSYESKVTSANQAIIASGNYAGVTAGSLLQMADRIGIATGRAGDAATILTRLAGTGKISSNALSNVGEAALDMAQVTGENADKMADYFAKIGDGAGKFAGEVLDKYGLISAATYERVAELEQQGAAEQAQDVLAEALKNASQHRLAELQSSLGKVQTAWEDARHAASTAWQSFSQGVAGAAGALTPEQELDERQKWKAGQLDSTNLGISFHDAISGDGNDDRIAQLQQIIEKNKEIAQQRSLDTEDARAGKTAYTELAAAAKAAETPAEKLHDAQQKIIKDWDALSRTNPDSNFLKTHTLQGLLDATAAAHAKKGPDEGQNVINGQLRSYDDDYRAREDALKTSLTHVESLRSQGLISLESSLQQAHDLRQAALDDELAITQKAEEVAAGKKQLSALQKYQDQEKKIRQAMVDNDQKTADDIATAYTKQQAAVEAYTQALRVQLAAQQNAVDIEVNAVSQGSDQSSLAKQINQIQQQYAEKSRQLAQQLGKPNGISQEQYDEQLAQLQKWQSSAVGIVTNGHEAMLAAEGNWANGANRALEDYEAKAADVAGQTADVFTSAFSGMEDALVQFTSTGKLNFSSLATSILADIARIEIRALASNILGGSGLGSLISGFMGSSGTSTSALSGVTSLFGASSAASYTSSVTPYVFHLASGGPVYGPGTSTSDSIPAMLSDGEGVLSARGMAALGGVQVLNRLNEGRALGGWQHFATGGAVGSAQSVDVPQSGSGPQFNLSFGGKQGDSVSDADIIELQKMLDGWWEQKFARRMKGQGGAAWRQKYGSVG